MKPQTTTILKGVLSMFYLALFSFILFGTVYSIIELINLKQDFILTVMLSLTVSSFPFHYALWKHILQKK